MYVYIYIYICIYVVYVILCLLMQSSLKFAMRWIRVFVPSIPFCSLDPNLLVC